MAVTQAQIDEAVRLAKEYGATRVLTPDSRFVRHILRTGRMLYAT